MEMLAALLVLVFAIGVTSWALVAHRGGMRFAGPHSSAPATARSFAATNASQSHLARGLYDQDEVEHDDVERDIWGDPISPPETAQQDVETTEHDDVVIEWARNVPDEHDLWGDADDAGRRADAEVELRVQPVDDGIDIWADATDQATSSRSR